MKKITRRQALAGSGLAIAGAAIAGRRALSQSGDPHAGHQMPAPMDHSQHGDHSGPAMTAQTNPMVTESNEVYRTPKGNPWYARTVDPHESFPPGEPDKDYTPVVVPNGSTLPFNVVDETKVFHLIAEEIEHEFAPGFKAICWGYNGRTPGPVIEAVEGDNIRIYVTNKLAVPTSVHWHGIILPMGMDGVSGLTQRTIKPGETFRYEFSGTPVDSATSVSSASCSRRQRSFHELP